MKIKSLKWGLAFKVIPIVVLIILVKFFVHANGYEFLSLSPLFGAIISANVFLIGFLISGVLVDYKESEKIPGEMACSLEVLVDESWIIWKNKKAQEAKEFIEYVRDLTSAIMEWLHKKERTSTVVNKIAGMNKYFLAFEPLTQANFIARLKQEQNNLRRTITRIHTIRETSFNPAGYAIAEIISIILCVGLIFTRIDPYYESIFFIAFVSFILIYMVLLIKDLDNPFGYYEKESISAEVSLKPLKDLKTRISILEKQ